MLAFGMTNTEQGREVRLRTERVGGVVIARFDNPPHNLFDEQTSVELDDLTRWVERDETVGAVVFTGSDRPSLTSMSRSWCAARA